MIDGIRIVSEKGSYTTDKVKVYQGDTEIKEICDIKIHMTPESFISAEITVLVSELDINAEAIIKKVCPRCNGTIEGNDKLSRIKRMAENIICSEDLYSDKIDFKKHATMLARCCLKEIERD